MSQEADRIALRFASQDGPQKRASVAQEGNAMSTVHSMTAEERTSFLEAQIAKLMEDNAKLRSAKQGKLTLKVSKAGGVSVYGMGKWPVTLYKGQWQRLLASAGEIEAFIEANEDLLSVKE